jgi:hypothetical protein
VLAKAAARMAARSASEVDIKAAADKAGKAGKGRQQESQESEEEEEEGSGGEDGGQRGLAIRPTSAGPHLALIFAQLGRFRCQAPAAPPPA